MFAGTDTMFMGLLSGVWLSHGPRGNLSLALTPPSSFLFPRPPGESLSRAYAAADVFVMPSESETLGFVVLEAMASQVGSLSPDPPPHLCLGPELKAMTSQVT